MLDAYGLDQHESWCTIERRSDRIGSESSHRVSDPITMQFFTRLLLVSSHSQLIGDLNSNETQVEYAICRIVIRLTSYLLSLSDDSFDFTIKCR